MTGQRERITVRPQAMLEAKDLPHNDLSRMLEQRVYQKLQEDCYMRAQQLVSSCRMLPTSGWYDMFLGVHFSVAHHAVPASFVCRASSNRCWSLTCLCCLWLLHHQGIMPDDVPKAEGLTIRVINNVIKKCEVKPKFYDAFRGDGFAEAFIYRQRVIILFQKLDGVDVALYCMYVQEYGNDCPAPNRNVVYLSYIDSVKYFRPEVQAANGISLRTFVYHQILQGYLTFVKNLGFETMYIWACPPLAVSG